MINYADYDFYIMKYAGQLSDNLFNSLIPKASREIDKVVNKELTEVDIDDKVRFVACELVDFLNANNNNNNNQGVSSISIDGVSKTYINKSTSQIKYEMLDIINGLPQELTRCL